MEKKTEQGAGQDTEQGTEQQTGQNTETDMLEIGVRAALCGGITIGEFAQMVEAVGDVPNTVKIPDHKLGPFLGKQRSKLWASVTQADIDKEISRCQKIGIRLLCSTDEKYPEELRLLPEAPLLLYAMGDLDFCYERSVSIVGSRRCSVYGRSAAHDFAADLARSGAIVYSGLARGIDTQAHRGALDVGGATIAVMGRGLAKIYPSENKNLAKEMVDSGRGLLLSEFALDAPPLPFHFPRRNRLISALSRAVMVVEGGMKSGTLSTVNWALDQGREVFALPGSVNTPGSELAHHLIREGATLVRKAGDILESLGDWSDPIHEAELKALPDDALGRQICAILESGPTQEEDICVGCADCVRSDVIARLTLLEIESLAVREAGGMFRLKL